MSRGMRWARTCSTQGEMRNAYTILYESMKGGYHLEDQHIYGRIILK